MMRDDACHGMERPPAGCYAARLFPNLLLPMKIVAVTACPTGIAHTYMAAEALEKAATGLGIKLKVETQGAMGLENTLTARDIAQADLVLIASDVPIEQQERFTGCRQRRVKLESVLLNAQAVLRAAMADAAT